MSLLRWTSKSSTKLATELVGRGFEVSSRTVLRLLHALGYSLQANAKVTEGAQHPDRDGQFHYLNDLAQGFVEGAQPVISVDTKKRSSSATTPTAEPSGHPPVSLNRSRSTTSPTGLWASLPKRSRMASTTWPTTGAG
jgi:hypothetical protein